MAEIRHLIYTYLCINAVKNGKTEMNEVIQYEFTNKLHNNNVIVINMFFPLFKKNISSINKTKKQQ